MISGIDTIFIWIWENFSDDIIKFSKEHLKTSWQKFGFKQAAKRYGESIKEQNDVVQIWRMSRPVSLKKIFTHVNVLDNPCASRRTSKELLEQMYRVEASFGNITERGVDAMQAVCENKRLFILGKPGAGKTTFLKYLTLQSIEGKLDCIPIFIPLKNFSESNKSLFEFILHQFDICGFPDAQLFIETALKRGESYKITKKTLSKLNDEKIPDDILLELAALKEQEYPTKNAFLDDLEKIIGFSRYKSVILKHAKEKNFKLIEEDFDQLNNTIFMKRLKMKVLQLLKENIDENTIH